MKVDNAPAARPPVGLGQADLIVEEPVEGGLTRLVAVFQCGSAPRVEPVRSARLVDPDILASLGSVGLAHAGGIAPAVDKLDRSAVHDVGDVLVAGAYHRDPSRSAPHNLYVDPTALWSRLPSTPPAAQFSFAAKPPPGTAGTAVHIPFSGYSDVTWTYDAARSDYRRSYSATAALSADGAALTAANVVVEKVALSDSGFVEDATGEHESNVAVTGRGDLVVYRDGVRISGTWQRGSTGEPTRLLDSTGKVIALRPGRTWVELVPTSVAVS